MMMMIDDDTENENKKRCWFLLMKCDNDVFNNEDNDKVTMNLLVTEDRSCLGLHSQSCCYSL